MNTRFRKASALFATVALMSSALLVVVAAGPASAAPNPCQNGCDLGSFTNHVGSGSGSADYTLAPNYQLGLKFHVNAPGTIDAISYYQAPSEPLANHPLSLFDMTTSLSVCSPCATATPGGPGFIAATFTPVPVLPGHTYVASYGETTALGYNSPSVGLPWVNGTLVGEGSAASPGVGSTAFATFNEDYGVNVRFFQVPNPVASNVRIDSHHVSLSFGDSGAASTTYSIVCTPPGGSGLPVVSIGATVGLTSPQTITLVPGFVYTCTVTATSPGGTGTSSTQASVLEVSGPGCPGTVEAPTQITAASMAFPGAVVSWAPAVADPQSCLSGYLVYPNDGTTDLDPSFVSAGSTTTHVLGLTLGSTYTFKVAGVTGTGVGDKSDATSPVTIGTPAAVTSVHVANAGKGAVKVAFKAGKANGAAITGFVAKCGSKSVVGKSSPIVVKGLKSGNTYHCTVRAANSRGVGAAARSAAVRA